MNSNDVSVCCDHVNMKVFLSRFTPPSHEQLGEGLHVEVGDSLHQLLLQVFLQQVYLDISSDSSVKAATPAGLREAAGADIFVEHGRVAELVLVRLVELQVVFLQEIPLKLLELTP